MLLYLMSSDELRELLERLGYRFTPDQNPAHGLTTTSATSNGSTLSGVVHTLGAGPGEPDRALEMFQQVLKSDVSDIQGGTTSKAFT